MIDLRFFQKPQRYIGNEWNVIKKSHEEKIKICLSYPDLYEVGMSNLGLRIIYGLLNEFNDVVCERVFLPGNDLANFLMKGTHKLFSLETKTPLNEFEILGFNLNYELNFTNFLHILSLGGVPQEAIKRKEIIVIAGGIANPEPLAEFVDLFCLGEFEEVAGKFINVLRKYKDKESRLRAFCEIEGFYVPKFYSVVFKNNRYNFEKIYPYANFPLKRVYVKDLDKTYYPSQWLTPYTQIIHDRAEIEVARGCPNHCFFCQARSLYYPYRERKASTITRLIREIYARSGYEDFSFLALSISDHSLLESLIDENFDYFQDRRIGLSLPSLRVTDIVGRLYKRLISLKKTSLTVAVEVAQDSLRSKLNKKVDINKLYDAAEIIHSLKIKHIKVYFMFGFHQEEEQDLIAIGSFLSELSRQSKLSLNVSINIFVPKPFSLWEQVKMQRESCLDKKREIILKNIPRTGRIRVSLAHPKKSILEAIISRADRRFSSVIRRVYFKEAGLSQDKDLRWDIWEEAMREEKIDYRFYLEEELENFPWSFIRS